jgi:uncharacterized membrane protein YbhN (UPF0104 family)
MSAGALTRRGVLLAITAVSLYLFAPALLEVFGAFDELDEISPLWFPVMLALQIGSYACMWGIQRLAVRTDRWGAVITSQLAANSFGRVVPGGVAAAGAVQYAMLVRAGVPSAAAASGMTASSLLLFVLMVALGAACVIWDRPLILAGRATQAIRNRVRKDREPLTGLPQRLLSERDIVLSVLGREWWEALLLAAGRWLLDYLTLVAALYAVDARPHVSLVLLAFCTAQLLGTMPLTPGGLGFVEAGLTGTLALAGVGGGAAVLATLAYRLVSFWLPIPAGAVAAVIHRRRYGAEEVEPPPTPTPGPGAASPDPRAVRSPPTMR